MFLLSRQLPIVRVYIEDCRFSLPQKTVALLSLPVLDRINCAPGGFHVLSKNLVSALQESNSSIEILPGKNPSLLIRRSDNRLPRFVYRFRWCKNIDS
jgi:hypothetical protein